jgi:hypothetical protein
MPGALAYVSARLGAGDSPQIVRVLLESCGHDRIEPLLVTTGGHGRQRPDG